MLNAVKFCSILDFIQLKHIYCKNCDFRMLDVNKICILTSKFIILHFKSTIMFTLFSDERILQLQLANLMLTSSI